VPAIRYGVTMRCELRRIPGEASLADAHAVRRAVFIDEQGVSEAEEMDGRDEAATHIVAYADPDDNREHTDPDSATGHDGTDLQPVGTARLRLTDDGVAKPERVAVLEPYRSEGVGRQLMAAIEREARDQGCTRARLHGQTAVETFYHDLGYETTSDVFLEADIPHVEMEKQL
jgi:predicted GNAT family N-acyltransferase